MKVYIIRWEYNYYSSWDTRTSNVLGVYGSLKLANKKLKAFKARYPEHNASLSSHIVKRK